MKTCIDCGGEVQGRYIRCVECYIDNLKKHYNNYNKKRKEINKLSSEEKLRIWCENGNEELRKNDREYIKEIEEKWGISQYNIYRFGPELLDSNPELLKSLQLIKQIKDYG